jgi:uncharacterized protein YjiS (DUF1127 family)
MLPSRQKKAPHQQLAAKSDFSRKSDGLCFPSHCPMGDRLNVRQTPVMERAMSTMKHSAANSRVFRSSPWSAVRTLIVEWRRRVRSRYELRSLGDAELRDIGLTRGEADFDQSKSFWLS